MAFDYISQGPPTSNVLPAGGHAASCLDIINGLVYFRNFTDANGETGWLPTGSPVAAPTGSIQFNSNGALGGNAALTWDNVGDILTVGVSNSIDGKITLAQAFSSIVGTIIQSGNVLRFTSPADMSFTLGDARLFTVQSHGQTTINFTNTTLATSGTSASSALINLNGSYWTGAASALDQWQIQDIVANGTNGLSTLTFTHAGSPNSAVAFVGPGTLSFPNWKINTNPVLLGNNNYQAISVLATGHGLGIVPNATSGYCGVPIINGGGALTTGVATQFGATYFLSVGGDFNNGSAYSGQVLFAPTTGSLKFVAAGIAPHINETSTATNDYTVLQLTSIEQAFLGTNSLILDCQLACPITNIVETAGNVVTLTVQNNVAISGQSVYLEGLLTGTWLNGQTVTLTAGTNATTLVFTDPTAHGAQASHAEIGRASLSTLQITKTGLIRVPSNNTATTATAGAQTLPANPAGFLTITVAGTTQKIPYYNA